MGDNQRNLLVMMAIFAMTAYGPLTTNRTTRRLCEGFCLMIFLPISLTAELIMIGIKEILMQGRRKKRCRRKKADQGAP